MGKFLRNFWALFIIILPHTMNYKQNKSRIKWVN